MEFIDEEGGIAREEEDEVFGAVADLNMQFPSHDEGCREVDRHVEPCLLDCTRGLFLPDIIVQVQGGFQGD